MQTAGHETLDRRTLARPKSNPQGLTDSEADERIGPYGYNELVEKRQNPVLKLLSYFWGPIPWMIEAAAAHWRDFVIILVLLVLNALVGFWEEYHADNAIEARVRRGGTWRTIASRELVPGDIIPADAMLMEAADADVDQSALTGESLPVKRTDGQIVYSGSVLSKGEVDALVTATGADALHWARGGL